MTEIHPGVSLWGTYEDEGVEPMGAFVFGLDYSDWGELEVDIDYDIWDDDPDHRDEVFGELYSLRDDLCDAYLLHMEDIGKGELNQKGVELLIFFHNYTYLKNPH